MAAITLLNPKAEYAKSSDAFALNVMSAVGLQNVLKSNLGPKGTMKALVSGAGDVKVTKDGNVLLREMQIKNPIASLIAKTCTAMDDIIGDGTTSTVLFIAELLKRAESFINDGSHPRCVSEGFELARNKVLEILEEVKIPVNEITRDVLDPIVRTSLRSKLAKETADALTFACVEALMIVKKGMSINLDIIEIMSIKSKLECNSVIVKGLVLDHGGRHPDMPKIVKDSFILTCNVNLEFENAEVHTGFFYNTAEQREKLVESEINFIREKAKKIIELKKKVCDENKGFVVMNQKGIQPDILHMFAKENILALRRVKKRNMERLTLACGGYPLNSLEDLNESCLGNAGLVYEQVVGDEKFTFVTECAKPESVTILLYGPTNYAINQLKDAVRDGLCAGKNLMEDGGFLPGAGAIEMMLSNKLLKYAESVKERQVIGIKAFAEALLIVPRTLAINSGLDKQEVINELQWEIRNDPETTRIGLNLDTGKPMDAIDNHVYDNYCVKKQYISSSAVVAGNVLLVDDVMRAGLPSFK